MVAVGSGCGCRYRCCGVCVGYRAGNAQINGTGSVNAFTAKTHVPDDQGNQTVYCSGSEIDCGVSKTAVVSRLFTESLRIDGEKSSGTPAPLRRATRLAPSPRKPNRLWLGSAPFLLHQCSILQTDCIHPVVEMHVEKKASATVLQWQSTIQLCLSLPHNITGWKALNVRFLHQADCSWPSPLWESIRKTL